MPWQPAGSNCCMLGSHKVWFKALLIPSIKQFWGAWAQAQQGPTPHCGETEA